MTVTTFRSEAQAKANHHLHVDWLPDAVTSISLVLGCLSLVSAFDHHYEHAAALIDFSLVCDVLDGIVARISHSAAPFGAELDSLADVAAFGVAPAGLVYSWALRPLGLCGVLVIGPFVICAALRLASFDLQTSSGGAARRPSWVFRCLEQLQRSRGFCEEATTLLQSRHSPYAF